MSYLHTYRKSSYILHTYFLSFMNIPYLHTYLTSSYISHIFMHIFICSNIVETLCSIDILGTITTLYPYKL